MRLPGLDKGLLLSGLSGLLLVFGFVPWDYSYLTWFGLVPILSVLLPFDSQKQCQMPFRYGFFMGLIFWLGTVYWLYHVTFLGMLSLGSYLALYFGVWAWLMTKFRSQCPEAKGLSHCWIALWGSSAWVSMEWIRSWMFGGFPWNNMGVSQYQNLAQIQIAAWTGVYGISFILVFFNISLWLAFRRMVIERFSMKSWRYEFTASLALLFLNMSFGLKTLLQMRGEATETLNLGMIQPDIPQEVKYEPMSREKQENRLKVMTMNLNQHEHPNLILWPETALVYGPSFNPENRIWMEGMMEDLKTPLLFGTLEQSREEEAEVSEKFFNSVVFLSPDLKWGPAYHKMHLVPFGEYVPLESWIPWLRKLVPFSGNFAKGGEPVLFQVGKADLGALICFEDTFSRLARLQVKKGADVLVNFTNDAWFKKSTESKMHAINSLFRSVETHRPLVRCTNHGQTSVFSSNGQILFWGEPFKPGQFVFPLKFDMNESWTFYTRYGDLFSGMCIIFTLLGLRRLILIRK